MKKRRIALVISMAVLVLTVLGMSAIMFTLSGTVGDLAVEVTSGQADAILASANVKNDTVVSVPILYYDQKMDDCVDIYNLSLFSAVRNRQFEWASCGYYANIIEKEMVEGVLGDDYLPIAVGGGMLSNRGVWGDNFERWFHQVDGVSVSYAGTLALSYDSGDKSFRYENEEFYPLDEIDLVSSESVNSDGHNHLFTLSLGVPFQVLADGNEEFEIAADDDTWVFVGDKMVFDMGGIHDVASAHFTITEEGEVYSALGGEDYAYAGVKLKSGDSTIVRIFHADRNSENSVFKLYLKNMLPSINSASLAKSDGVELAYDPANPSYIAPLGESMKVEPDKMKSLAVSVVVQTTVVCMLAVILIVATSVVMRYSRRGRNLE